MSDYFESQPNSTAGHNEFGVSFSIKYARELGVDPKACLESALKELGVKRLRLMSYWDVHEPGPGAYDFKELDWQFALAKKYGANVTLSVGLRQPRWPESHWPDWTHNMSETLWQTKLLTYIEVVVNRYKSKNNLASWQLENEALLKTFDLNGNFDRKRLKREFTLLKKLDSRHPIIMTTSDSWGIPLHAPRPDIFGISVYRRFYDRDKYRQSHRPALFYKLRGKIISQITNRPVFIHELQAEPWGPKSTVKLELKEQSITMNKDYLVENITFARHTGLLPAYLWGVEWWYWNKISQNNNELWLMAKQLFSVQ